MAIYQIIIEPLGAFGTPLKGDTIFGHFCWQAIQYPDLLNSPFHDWVDRYPQQPFAVFSSAWPIIITANKVQYVFKRPDMPSTMLPIKSGHSRKEQIEKRKDNKKKKWLLANDLNLVLEEDSFIADDKLIALSQQEQQQFDELPKKYKKIVTVVEQHHNTINRLTMTTGEGIFAPYTLETYYFLPGIKLVIFAFIDKEATDMNRLRQAFERIGQWGFGRDASTGLGRFRVIDCQEVNWPKIQPEQACYTLGPCVPQQGVFQCYYFAPFTRFGRHGANLVLTGKPFKNPVIMADEGAVLCPKTSHLIDKPYIGTAITNLSKAEPRTISQGYSIYLPLFINRRNYAD